VVPNTIFDDCPRSSGFEPLSQSPVTSRFPREETSLVQQNDNSCMFVVREKLTGQGFSPSTINIILSSWRKGTQSQYNSSLQKWLLFCREHHTSIFSPSVSEALDFLTSLYHKGLSYSAINTARSALSSVLLLGTDTPFGQLPIVTRFMKGIFELRPAFPRHKEIWDLNLVFDYFRKQKPPSQLSLKELSLKVTFLLSLLSGQRCQTISYLRVDNMTKLQDKYVFPIVYKLKQSRINHHLKPLEFLKYPPDEKICIVSHLDEYIKRTAILRGNEKQLLLSFTKPYSPISKDSISRWIKSSLLEAGIDTTKFNAHSTRSASSSYLASQSISVIDIMNSVGWSNEQVFQRYYNKPIENNFNYGHAILNSINLSS